jgi:transcriptional/translational regulatory protein YebC/TACO1
LSDLIHPDDNLLSATLSKEFYHYKTIELVKEIGRMRPVDLEELEDIVSKAKSLRHIRNDFVHGIWDIDDTNKDKITARCSQRDISYEQKGAAQRWKQGYKTRKVDLEKLRDVAIKVENLTERVQKLIDEIEENPQDFNG